MSGQAGEVRIEHNLSHEKSKEELFMLKGVIFLLSFLKRHGIIYSNRIATLKTSAAQYRRH